jgi:2-iminoacetate synthase ThiH
VLWARVIVTNAATLQIVMTAHSLGLRTTSTMMFGHCETPHHVVCRD